MAIGSDLDLAAMLRRIIEAACDLVDARYGALGVLNPTAPPWPSSSPSASTRDAPRHRRPAQRPRILGLLIADPGRCGCRT